MDKAARGREEVILKQLEEKEPLPDKEKDQMAWVRAANQYRAIVEEQNGEERAEYGTGLLKELSKQMTQDFGRGFTVANLKNMR